MSTGIGGGVTRGHGLVWGAGQALWTYIDVFGQGVPVVSPTDPIFFVSSIPIAAALYGRPEHDRPRWLRATAARLG